jgi:hypothetical protein
MYTRRATALVAVGWYLMSPLPDVVHDKLVHNGPSQYWTMEGSFDTAAQCKDGLRSDVQLMMSLERQHKSNGLGLAAATAAQCIANDDPCLAAPK